MTANRRLFGTGGLAAAALLFAATAAGAGSLEVSVSGLRSTEGVVRIALHRNAPAGAFPGEASVVGGKTLPANPDGVRVVFSGLTPGDYAVAAFHDADNDGKLGQNIMRIPTEGFGFSNGALGSMGPPGFDDASVTVGPGGGRASVVVPIAYAGS